MFRQLKIKIIVFLALVNSILITSFSLHADIHVIYENQINKEKTLEIYVKNKFFKLKNQNNSIKLINYEQKTIVLYENGNQKYLQLPLQIPKNIEKNSKNRSLFSPKLEILEFDKQIMGYETIKMSYTSSIDPKISILTTEEFPLADLKFFGDVWTHIPTKGNELIKEPAYYYSIVNGYMPIQLMGTDFNWKAIVLEKSQIDPKNFLIPEGMVLWKTKEYFKEAVEKISQDLESQINP